MSSPWPTMIICSVYIYFVKFLGPRLMKDRPAFELKGPIIVYNALQVIVSTYLVYGVNEKSFIKKEINKNWFKRVWDMPGVDGTVSAANRWIIRMIPMRLPDFSSAGYITLSNLSVCLSKMFLSIRSLANWYVFIIRIFGHNFLCAA